MQLSIFQQDGAETLVEDIFRAYFECRKNKRNTMNALQFEANFEEKIFTLTDDIRSGRYRPGRSVAFIVNRPVKREIFAAGFRDRVVHHYIIGKLNPLFEKLFCTDSYACRKGKGTHYGIRRMEEHIRQASNGYTQKAFVLKLDIRGFFMHISRPLLYRRLEEFVLANYHQPDRELLLWLCRLVIFNDPARNCLRKGGLEDWTGLPPDKSLFSSPPGCGLPIGNLSSQVFANFYLHPLDVFIQETLDFAHYGRYVDDFVLVSSDKEKLKKAVPQIREFLRSNLGLQLHPQKCYLQEMSKGLPFLGTVLYPGRIFPGRRCKANFIQAVHHFNALACSRPLTTADTDAFLSSLNSYLGIMRHWRSYRFRRRILYKKLVGFWWQRVQLRRSAKSFRRVKTSFACGIEGASAKCSVKFN